jgi:hypothetical protein
MWHTTQSLSDRHEARQMLGPIIYSLWDLCDGITVVFLFIVLQMGLSLLGAVTVVAVVNVWMLLPTVIMFSVFYMLRVYFVATSRSVKRLEGISKLAVDMSDMSSHVLRGTCLVCMQLRAVEVFCVEVNLISL